MPASKTGNSFPNERHATPHSLRSRFQTTYGYNCLVLKKGSTAPQDEPSLSSTLDTEEQDQDEELEEEESATGPSHAPRGVPRKNARRARGRRVAGARARVVTKRLHGGRRNPVPPSTIDNDATLEETINTDSEEPPMQSTAASELEQKPSAAESKIDTTAVTANGTSTVRVSGNRAFVSLLTHLS